MLRRHGVPIFVPLRNYDTVFLVLRTLFRPHVNLVELRGMCKCII